MMLLKDYHHMSYDDAKQLRPTYKALKDLDDVIEKRIITDFNGCMQFLAGYTRGEFVDLSAIVDQLNEWVSEGRIKPYHPEM